MDVQVTVNHNPLIEVGDVVVVAGWGQHGKTHHSIIRYADHLLAVELHSSRVRHEFSSMKELRAYYDSQTVIEILRHKDYQVSIQKL